MERTIPQHLRRFLNPTCKKFGKEGTRRQQFLRDRSSPSMLPQTPGGDQGAIATNTGLFTGNQRSRDRNVNKP
ncbi:MAG: hypothetical protein HC925_03530 [Coleofasciculaceae cyanobacterium SM2_3_26]|nr:hypothetical protein [Coleofasciculaceae cyanobacterium SM2_3_26]